MFITELNVLDGAKDRAPWEGLAFWDSGLLAPRSEVNPLPFFFLFLSKVSFKLLFMYMITCFKESVYGDYKWGDVWTSY